MKEAVILGYSGHSYVVIDTVIGAGYKVLGYLETESKEINPYRLTYLGIEDDLKIILSLKEKDFFLGIGSNKIRAKIFTELIGHGLSLPFIVDSTAKVSPKALLGNGTVVLPGAIINSCATIGKAVICNSSSVIEHECEIGDFCHIAPGAVLAGNVKVGLGSFIGANAVIKQGIKIGDYATIGAGAVVIKDVASGATVYGNPAKSNR